MVEVKQLLADGWLHVRVIIELVGKPKEHIEETMQGYVEKIKKTDDLKVIEDKTAEIKKVDTKSEEEGTVKEMWATFAEIDMMVKNPMALTFFCFDYMPSSIEISDPEEIKFTNADFAEFFNDLQARLHQLDALAKQFRSEVIFLRTNTTNLIRNFTTILLTKQGLTSKQLSNVTGVKVEALEDMLDKWIDEGIIKQNEDLYELVKKDEN
jgi:hypothetical protein